MKYSAIQDRSDCRFFHHLEALFSQLDELQLVSVQQGIKETLHAL